MSIKAKIAALIAVELVITGSVASTTTPAQARGFHHGWASAQVSSAPRSPRTTAMTCHWVPRFDVGRNDNGCFISCGYRPIRSELTHWLSSVDA
jgi:hypothetical protein